MVIIIEEEQEAECMVKYKCNYVLITDGARLAMTGVKC